MPSNEPRAAGDAVPATENHTAHKSEDIKRKKDAFSELMASKRQKSVLAEVKLSSKQRKVVSRQDYSGRNGLLEYMREPERNPHGLVLYFSDDWVLIRDMYPKASVHLLLLPRDIETALMDPNEAFLDPDFLASARKEVTKAKSIAASELQRIHGRFSASDAARNEAMDGDDPPAPDQLPVGRNWEKELKAGVHANPSMNHLHIHILSKDNYSPALGNRRHYQSFNTEFLCLIDEQPLSTEEIRSRKIDARDALTRDSICWRCGSLFGSSWTRLKGHLDKEFEQWRQE